jgi:hypothetical protein
LSQLIDQALKKREFLQYVQKNVKGKDSSGRDDLDYSFSYDKAALNVKYEQAQKEYGQIRQKKHAFLNNYYSNFVSSIDENRLQKAILKLKPKEDALEKIKKSREVIDENQEVGNDDQIILKKILRDLSREESKIRNDFKRLYLLNPTENLSQHNIHIKEEDKIIQILGDKNWFIFLDNKRKLQKIWNQWPRLSKKLEHDHSQQKELDESIKQEILEIQNEQNKLKAKAIRKKETLYMYEKKELRKRNYDPTRE